jgi:ABC-2 type transport system permease protein
LSKALIVFRKEFRELVGVRSSLLTGIAFALLFGGMYSFRLTGDMPLALDLTLGSLLFFLSTMIGAFLGYSSTSQVFLREKLDQVVETLLCSPANLRDIWLGKTLAVTLFADLMAVGAGLITSAVTSARMGTLALPNAAVILYLVFGLPLVIACLVGALGYAQLLLGMKENRIIGLALFIPIFAGLYGIGYTSTGTLAIGWPHVSVVGLVALVVLGVLGWASRFLSRERIVTSLS